MWAGAIALATDDLDLKIDPAQGCYKGLTNADFGNEVTPVDQIGGDLRAVGDSVAGGSPLQILGKTYATALTVTGGPGVTSLDVVRLMVMLPPREVFDLSYPESIVFGISIQNKFS